MKSFLFLLLSLSTVAFLKKMHGFISMLNQISSRIFTRLFDAFKELWKEE
jgi:hypothetical protein